MQDNPRSRFDKLNGLVPELVEGDSQRKLGEGCEEYDD